MMTWESKTRESIDMDKVRVAGRWCRLVLGIAVLALVWRSPVLQADAPATCSGLEGEEGPGSWCCEDSYANKKYLRQEGDGVVPVFENCGTARATLAFFDGYFVPGESCQCGVWEEYVCHEWYEIGFDSGWDPSYWRVVLGYWGTNGIEVAPGACYVVACPMYHAAWIHATIEVPPGVLDCELIGPAPSGTIKALNEVECPESCGPYSGTVDLGGFAWSFALDEPDLKSSACCIANCCDKPGANPASPKANALCKPGDDGGSGADCLEGTGVAGGSAADGIGTASAGQCHGCRVGLPSGRGSEGGSRGCPLNRPPLSGVYATGPNGIAGFAGGGRSHNQTALCTNSNGSSALVGLEGDTSRFSISSGDSPNPTVSYSSSFADDTLTMIVSTTSGWTYRYEAYHDGAGTAAFYEGREVPLVEASHPSGITRRYDWETEYDILSTQQDSVVLTRQRTPDNSKHIDYEYDFRECLTRASDDTGQSIEIEYDNDDRITRVATGCTTCGGLEESYVYDVDDRLVEVKARDDVALLSYGYDDSGRLTSRGLGGGDKQVVWEYDAEGIVTARRSYVDNVNYERAEYVLNSYGRMASEVAWTGLNATGTPLTTSYEYTYGGANNKTLTRAAEYSPGGVTRYRYYGTEDANRGRVTKTSLLYAGGTELVLSEETGDWFDGVSLVASSLNSRGAESEYSYDDQWRVTAQTSGAPGFLSGNTRSVSLYEYDDLSRVTRSIQTDTSGSPTDVTTMYAYDANQQLTLAVEDEAGIEVSTMYAYDDYGNQTKTTDAEGRVRKVLYSETGFLTAEIAYETTENGNALAETQYEYDDYGRMTHRRVAAVDAPFAAGSAASYVSTVYEYDHYGRQTLAVEDAGTGGLQLGTTYEYDHQHRVIRTTTPGGVWTETVRDGRGLQVMQIVGYEGSSTGDQMTTLYAYDADGNVTQTQSPAGVVTTYVYDGYGRRALTIVE